ncbi:MAG: HAMP domain-containing sensor histidine kinase [Zetaproteobacteria bacterium]|nr:HAMP domain-containing sensor histidine kinase [Zetaproteobacteria bacterium]
MQIYKNSKLQGVEEFKWAENSLSLAVNYHFYFGLAIGLILPLWVVFDMYAAPSMLEYSSVFRVIGSFIAFVSAFMCRKGILNPASVAFIQTCILYTGVGFFIPFLQESELSTWFVSYSTCFMVVALAQVVSFKRHMVNLFIALTTIGLCLVMFGRYDLRTYITQGGFLTLSVAGVSSAFFYSRISFIKRAFILEIQKKAVQQELLQESAKVQRLEVGMLAKDRMAQMGVLASGIAHQLGNVLNVIQSALHVLESSTAPPELRAKAFQSCYASVELGDEIISGISDMNKTNQAIGPQNLAAIVRFAEVMAKGKMFENTQLHNELAEDFLAIGTKKSLTNILMNLFGNSADAGAGHIWVRKIGEHAIEVVDDGHGVPEEIADRMFDMFVTSKKEHEGTGVGMSVVEHEAKLIGAQVTFDKNYHEGARFTIHFSTQGTGGNA